MKDHGKKMIAPVLITIAFVLYLLVYAIGVFMSVQFHPLMILLALPLVALAAGMIYILRERIKEIKGGEEDDLDNY